MRTVEPQTGYTESDVLALLASRQFVFTDCYTITAPNGDKIRCTNTQRDVIVTPIGGGVNVTYTSNGVKVSGIRMSIGVGVEVDEQDAQLDFLPTDLFQGIPLARALLWGRFDGATVQRDRFFAQTWGGSNTPTAWVGGCRMFSGRLSELSEIGRSCCKFKVKSNLVLLNINMPATLFQPGCRHAIYDSGCGLDRGLFEVNGLIGAGSTPSVIMWTGALANMALGTVYIETAAGVTLIRSIREVVPGVKLLLNSPLEETPTVGYNFATFQGCDRSYSRCTALGNTDHFLGYPFVPTEETAI